MKKDLKIDTPPQNEFEKAETALRTQLLDAQFDLQEKKVPMIVIVSGMDGTGKGALITRLKEWFDPASVEVHAFEHPSDEIEERPFCWRYWHTLPSNEQIGLYFGGWYTPPMKEYIADESPSNKKAKADLLKKMERVADFETMLAADGTLIVKIWLHMSKRELSERFQKIRENERGHWKFDDKEWTDLVKYDRFGEMFSTVLKATHSNHAPWHMIHAVDLGETHLEAGRFLLKKMQEAIDGKLPKPRFDAKPLKEKLKNRESVLEKVDLTQKLDEEKFHKESLKLQEKLHDLAWKLQEKRITALITFEGWDAAGKGGATRQILKAVDPRLYKLIPFAHPNENEKAHHYLWRFWNHIPRDGAIAVYDRTWYGRVLADRIEKRITEEEYLRTYGEINDFEEQLVEHGVVLIKFWLHISADEQLRRFKAREKLPHKRYKLTDADWHNRKLRAKYLVAADDMFAITNTRTAPWTILGAEDRYYTRIQVLKTVIARLEKALKNK
jgi:polyphosphate:AMP phosphotransferase